MAAAKKPFTFQYEVDSANESDIVVEFSGNVRINKAYAGEAMDYLTTWFSENYEATLLSLAAEEK